MSEPGAGPPAPPPGGLDPLGGLGGPETPPPAAAPLRRLRGPTTIALLGVLLLGLAAQGWFGNGELEDPTALLRLGSLYGPAVQDGDWWRIGSYAFLHVGAAHFLMNAWALWILMRPVEATFGAAAALGLFAASALAGGGASAAAALLRGNVFAQAAGASGGIFGLFGATGGLWIRLRHRLPPQALRAAWRAMLVNLAINAALAFVFPVDNWAHGGGFVCGFLLALVAPLPSLPRRPWHAAASALLVGSALALFAAEGAAVARAVHPQPRVLRASGLRATLPWDLCPLARPGLAMAPDIGMQLGIAREPEPPPAEGEKLELGSRTWTRVRTGADGETQGTLLAAPDGAGRVVVEWLCYDDACRGVRGDDLGAAVAASLEVLAR